MNCKIQKQQKQFIIKSIYFEQIITSKINLIVMLIIQRIELYKSKLFLEKYSSRIVCAVLFCRTLVIVVCKP